MVEGLGNTAKCARVTTRLAMERLLAQSGNLERGEELSWAKAARQSRMKETLLAVPFSALEHFAQMSLQQKMENKTVGRVLGPMAARSAHTTGQQSVG